MLNQTAVNIIKHQKSVIRKTIKHNLNKIDERLIKRKSDIVVEKLFSLPRYKLCKALSVYVSTTAEIDTSSIILESLNNNRIVYVPRFKPKSPTLEMVKVHSVKDYENFSEVMWGIRQPPVDDRDVRENVMEKGELDLVVVPGVAFTANGLRLGHGRGYYDCFLNSYISKFGADKKPYVVGLAFKEQIVENLPVSDYDFKIDAVLYDEL